jgi:hypothetical protein
MFLSESKRSDKAFCVKSIQHWEQRKRTLLSEKYQAVSPTLCDWNYVEKRQTQIRAEIELLDQLIDICQQRLKLYE